MLESRNIGKIPTHKSKLLKTYPGFNERAHYYRRYEYKRHNSNVLFIIRKYDQNYMNTANTEHNFFLTVICHSIHSRTFGT